MTTYQPLDALRAMVAARDVDALAAALDGHYAAEQSIYGLTRPLQADRALADTLRARVSPWTARLLDRWLARTLHEHEVATREDFLALATRLARALDAALPGFEGQPLTESLGYCSSTAAWRWRDGAREATLLLESRDVGPAEVVQEEAWCATYRSPAGSRRLRYEASGTAPVMCWEEREEPPR